jgi:hypothetical protein
VGKEWGGESLELNPFSEIAVLRGERPNIRLLDLFEVEALRASLSDALRMTVQAFLAAW